MTDTTPTTRTTRTTTPLNHLVTAALLETIIDKHWPDVYDTRPFNACDLTLADIEHITTALDLPTAALLEIVARDTTRNK